MPEDQDKIARSGFDGFISKPISIKLFMEAVDRFLAAGRRPS